MHAGLGLLLLGTSEVRAQGNWEEQAKLLLQAEDFRVRTQAALALGASQEKKSLPALCQGLKDTHRTVKIASARALGRLRLGGQDCLKSRVEAEPDKAVRAALERALADLGAESAVVEPAVSQQTKYYLALGTLQGPSRLAGVVRSALVRGVAPRQDVAVAPVNETVTQATQVLSRYKQARGFVLSPQVAPPVYVDGRLEMKLTVTILSYPGQAILGTFSQSAAQQGVTEPSPQLEQELLVALAEAAMKKFLTLAPSL